MTLPWRPSLVTQILALILIKTRANRERFSRHSVNHMFVHFLPKTRPRPDPSIR